MKDGPHAYDAVTTDAGRIALVIDWKTDVAPTNVARASYRGQLQEYMLAVGAERGGLMYATLGELEWVIAPRSDPVP